MKKITINNLKIDENLIKFINDEAIPGTGLDSNHFWKEFSNVVHELAPKNKNLIKKREEIQKKIDDWHLSNKDSTLDKNKYTEFLKSINYIVEELRQTYKNVDRCYLEIEEPNIDQGIQSCQKNNPEVLVIVFYFLHEGAHVKIDVNNDLKPALEKSNLKKTCITKHLGADEKMIDLIIERAREVENAN